MEYIQYEAKDKIAIISLDRPEARNAQNRQFLDELDACWTKAAEDEPAEGAEGEDAEGAEGEAKESGGK